MNTNKQVVVRFAPSPTGMLHIGGARTAVFNYLFARHNNGKFLLRIEDTDTQRNSQEAIDEIINGIDWLGMDYDSDFLEKLNSPKECFYQGDAKKGIILQSTRYPRHLEIAEQLISKGLAYYAYDTQEEIEKKKKECEDNKIYYRYDGSKWKNVNDKEVQKNIEEAKSKGIKPVIRLNIPEGEVLMQDLIRGDIKFNNNTQDDFVLVRSNGVPTYMLAVVCDDMDMGITHVIRGDDHISNTPKQILIYQAIKKAGIKMLNGEELTIPQFAHIPLIYDIEGKKLSKRKHAVAVSDYEKQGYLSDAIFNYLLHLGWNDGTEKEIYSKEEAIETFSISRCGKSPSRFDFEKLKNINLHYIKQLPDEELFRIIEEKLNS
jgi:glutamyl-tRNA synthetase